MPELTGWLLDVYPDPQSRDLAVWLLAADGTRQRLICPFPTTCYAAGPAPRLRALWRSIQSRPLATRLARTERRELFSPQPLTLLSVEVAHIADQPRLLRQILQAFPDLDYYDADLHPLTRCAARFDVFPLAHCRVRLGADGQIADLEPLDDRWTLERVAPPLRILEITPDSDPAHAAPTSLTLRYAGRTLTLPLQPERALLAALRRVLRLFDPDLLLTDWGDTWLLPHLLRLSDSAAEPLPLNRDTTQRPLQKRELTYQAYGQVVHRGRQVHLRGRWHVDRRSAMMFGDYGLEGVFELARVTGLPLQVVARNSPGAGITAMQIITALRDEILVPYRKQLAEDYKTAQELIRLDQGGLVYPPLIGLHQDVAEIDFISQYPSIIRRFNISPEKMSRDRLQAETIARLEPERDATALGLLPRTLAPLLDQRIRLKEAILSELDRRDCRYQPYKRRAAALKWLLVVSFGYTGYKNAKYGRIEAHQAITAYAREVILVAKETAEELGFTVLHIYVDGLWVQRPGAQQPEDFQPLLEAIAARTHLPIALDGVFRWVVFQHSRVNPTVAVANRYFGVFQSGEIKTRGIEQRRRDTAPFVAQAQREMLALLAQAETPEQFAAAARQVVRLAQAKLAALRAGAVAVEQLVMRQRLSRAPEAYTTPSPAALAARQMEAAGKPVRVGQYVQFVYVSTAQKVLAWNLPARPPAELVDAPRYAEFLLRATASVLQPLGLAADDLHSWIEADARILPLPNLIPASLRRA